MVGCIVKMDYWMDSKKWMVRWMVRCMDRTNRWMVKMKDNTYEDQRQMDGWMDKKQMDCWMDRKKTHEKKLMDIKIYEKWMDG